MKKTLVAATLLAASFAVSAGQWVRINQLGYLPQSVKVAVFISEEPQQLASFELVNAVTGKTEAHLSTIRNTGKYGKMSSSYRLDFSKFQKSGSYYLKAGEAVSPVFPINTNVYNGTADFVLHYMRQQRCGYNPFLKDTCHQHDGYIEYHPTKSGQHIDVRGGWHDAGDYLQYTTTSANAMYQMMLAYEANPGAFGDYYDANGNKGANGIPDIVDEIKWGLDWLDRMNPEKGELYNQIADDRDHASFRSPATDKVDYGYGPGLGRPVYFCSGEPQQRGKFMNATTGVASTAGKFASSFALGAKILKDFYPEFAEKIGKKAVDAYEEGVKKPGVCQTASVVSNYIYEEVNWVDDMELGAAELYRMTGNPRYLKEAVEYGRQEPITPWMGADSAKHYQWYPFMNVGHYRLANVKERRLGAEFARNLRSGIERTYQKAVKNPYLFGIPAIWCSNNLTTAMVTQCMLYREATGDSTYVEMEAALRDWLFGCNPWGTSMVVELPYSGDYPAQPHSAYVQERMGNATGGLVDGPVYSNIFNSLRGVNLTGLPWLPSDNYEQFQPDDMVYHDAIGDYSTNEPTMDGTASMTYFLSSLQSEGMRQAGLEKDANIYSQGGIVRTDVSRKEISLVFTAHKDCEGAEKVLRLLKKYDVPANFFFTGYFFENNGPIVEELVKRGYYVGGHSYGHLHYIDWKNPDSTLISQKEFTDDIRKCFDVMSKYGLTPETSPCFMPPFEEYNAEVASWAQKMGLSLVNYTPGTGSNMDYTTPDLSYYQSSKAIYDRIVSVEKKQGLNGHILLLHLGTDANRTDKFYDKYLGRLLDYLKKQGYSFRLIQEAVGF